MGKLTEWIKSHIILSIVIAVVVIYGMKLGIDFSSAPAFCRMACHDMIQDVDAWKISYHGSGNNGKPQSHEGHKADCHGCHYDPGVVGLMKGKMVAMLSILHEITGEKGELLSEVPEEEKEHILPQYIHITKNKKREYICPLHGEKRRTTNDACKRCHAYKVKMVKANALLDVQKDMSVDSKEIVKVNSEAKLPVKGGEKFLSPVNASHTSHEDRGLICLDCHQEIAHAPKNLGIGPYNLPRMEICFRCHNGKKAFRDDCEKCHIGQLMMHAGKGAKDVEDNQGLMFADGKLQASCADCGHEEGNKYKADVSACDGCHEKGYSNMVSDWHTAYEEALKPVKDSLEIVEKGLKKAGKKHSSDVATAKTLYEEAKYNYDYAVKDGSRGAHNNDYAVAMLSKSKEKLEEAKSLLKLK